MVKTLLGHQLVENKIITEKQLDRALEYQKEKSSYGVPIRLGAALVELGFCTDEEISKTISAKTGYDFISLNNIDIDLMAANLIPLPLIKRYKAFAIGFEDEKLMVAMANPNDLLAIDDLSLITGYSIKPTVVSDAELAGVIERYGNTSTELVQNIDDDDDDNDNGVADNIDDAEKPAVLLVSQIINNGIKTGASDIHIEPQEKYLRIRYRIDGVLHEVMEQSRKLHASVISRIKVMSGMDIAERRVPQDGRATIKLDGKTVDLRVASLPSAYGERMTIRILNRNAKNITIEELGFPSKDNARYMETIHLPYGFLLVTGPTGSGKSTTLYATLAELNSTEKNLITLEDPIERRMDGLNQIQMNTKANMTFASGLRSILR
ncbi:MAG: ATPase, T2SS/T4P/T4SS family, partial [Oscillospiraceae bacterium]